MKKILAPKTFFALSALTFLFALIACGPSPTPPTANNSNNMATPTTTPTPTPTIPPFNGKCTGPINDAINLDLYNRTVHPTTGDATLRNLKTSFNYYSKDCVVILYGTLPATQKQTLQNIVLLNATVESMDRKSLYADIAEYPYPRPPEGSGGDCGKLEPCGDICVPPGQCQTNRPDATPTPTPTGSPLTKPTATPSP